MTDLDISRSPESIDRVLRPTSRHKAIVSRGSNRAGFVIQTLIERGNCDYPDRQVVTITKQPGIHQDVYASVRSLNSQTSKAVFPYERYAYDDHTPVTVDFAVAALQQHLPDRSAENALYVLNDFGIEVNES